MECTYIIKTKADITQAMLDVCVQDSISNLRTSIDGLLAILKWELTDPPTDPPVFDGDTKFTHAQMLTEMTGANWTQSTE